MISHKKYLDAKKIVDQYENEQFLQLSLNVGDFKIGDKVKTVKGCRIKGAFNGIVIGFGKWSNYDAVKVRKEINNKIVMCLTKNLVLL